MMNNLISVTADCGMAAHAISSSLRISGTALLIINVFIFFKRYSMCKKDNRQT